MPDTQMTKEEANERFRVDLRYKEPSDELPRGAYLRAHIDYAIQRESGQIELWVSDVIDP